MHQRYEELLIRYHNGECDENEYAAIKEHLKNCDKCKKNLMEMRFDISYNPEEEMSEEKQMLQEANANNAGLKALDGNDKDSKKTAAIESEDGAKKESNIAIKNKKTQILICAAIVGLVIILLYFGLNLSGLNEVNRDFARFFSESFFMPDDYDSFTETVENKSLGDYKSDLKQELLEYFVEENDDFNSAYVDIARNLNRQTNGYQELIYNPKEVSDIRIKRIFLFTAEVEMIFIGDEEEEEYLYNIKYKRKNNEWKIEELRMVE